MESPILFDGSTAGACLFVLTPIAINTRLDSALLEIQMAPWLMAIFLSANGNTLPSIPRKPTDITCFCPHLRAVCNHLQSVETEQTEVRPGVFDDAFVPQFTEHF